MHNKVRNFLKLNTYIIHFFFIFLFIKFIWIDFESMEKCFTAGHWNLKILFMYGEYLKMVFCYFSFKLFFRPGKIVIFKPLFAQTFARFCPGRALSEILNQSLEILNECLDMWKTRFMKFIQTSFQYKNPKNQSLQVHTVSLLSLKWKTHKTKEWKWDNTDFPHNFPKISQY